MSLESRLRIFRGALEGFSKCAEYFDLTGNLAKNLYQLSDSISARHNFVKALRYSIFQCDRCLYRVGLGEAAPGPLLRDDPRDITISSAALLENELYYKIAHCVAHFIREATVATGEIGAAICRMQFPTSPKSFARNLDICVKFFTRNASPK